jgi:Flp pilus assembly protein TadG
MIQALKRLWRDRRGNSLVIFGAALPLVVGSAGLATDTIQWALWKRQLQRTADSAALAGGYALLQDKDATAAAQRDLLVNSHVGLNLTKSIQPPPTSGPFAGDPTAVRVTLSVQKKLGFSGLFLSATPTITTTATAKIVDQDSYCVVALKKSGPALVIAGSSHVVMGCGAISNSWDPNDAVDVNGESHYFEADPVAAAGGMPSSINGVTDLDPGEPPLPDPFENKYSTDVPAAAGNCTNSNHPSKTNADGSWKPGCYNNFNVPNGTTVLSPGVYYLNNADIHLTGQELIVGEGVTIVLTGSNPGSINMAGTSELQLTAPTDATCGIFPAGGVDSCLYKKMLIIQAANADPDNANVINGSNLTALDGALYFPKGALTFSGSSANSTKCAMVVGYTVSFSGNTNIQNDMTPADCDADQQVSGKAVRLVA